MWQKAVKPYLESGELVAVGVVQEQHPDRTRLYRQWRELEWPIFVDSMNVLEHIRIVPVPMAIDEAGVVVDASFKPNELEDFIESKPPDRTIPEGYNVADAPSFSKLREQAEEMDTVDAWHELGAAYFNYGADEQLDNAVAALNKAIEIAPDDPQAQFALGVALRRRYETEGQRKSDDAQLAVTHWEKALELDPNHYIFRRRLQQYGPRLDKPYNFYFWVEKAREDIRERGEKPVKLTAEPTGSEVAPPERAGEDVSAKDIPDPDPKDRIHHDDQELVRIAPLVTPKRVQPGHRIRGRATFRLNPKLEPYWNNEAGRLRMSIDVPEGFRVIEHDLAWPNPEKPETRELRELEFELEAGEHVSEGAREIPAYVLYYVCEDAGGVCYFLRQDFTFEVTVDNDAPVLK